MTTIEQALAVTSRAQLAEFVAELRREVRDHPDQVENGTLADYLEALSAYLQDLPGFVRNARWPGSAEDPSWALIAAILPEQWFTSNGRIPHARVIGARRS
jgi:hypothetical protein